jgi:trans-L-3-hydroxyproline dehydratase
MSKTWKRIQKNSQLKVPESWMRIKTIDMHTGGEPLRVVVEGFPELEGTNVLEYRRFVKEHHDDLRKALMWEPRGHADMYGCLLVPPNDEDADFGIIFMHNEGYSTMCGHATIAISRLAVEMGWVQKEEPLTRVVIDAPCGRLEAEVEVSDGNIGKARFRCVPSFVLELNAKVKVDGYGNVNYDLAYGGAFYAYVNSNKLGIDLLPQNYRKLIKTGMDIKHAVIESDQKVSHPFEEDLSFLYGTIFIGGPVSDEIDSRNVCVFAEGEVDRCPTGSGVSGRMAIHYARDEIEADKWMSIESITGSVFRGKVTGTTSFGPHKAVIPEVEGRAFVTGMNTFVIDPEDPMKYGFFLR